MTTSQKPQLFFKSKLAVAIFTLNVLMAFSTSVLAQSSTTTVTLPNRIFELSQSQFPKLVTDIDTEIRQLQKNPASLEKLQRLRLCLELVLQIKHYRSAMQTIDETVDNKIYATATITENALKQLGVTTESVALLGLATIKRGNWQKINASELENFETTSAIFLGAVEDFAAATSANLDLAKLFAELGQPTVSFDRFKDSVELVRVVADTESKNELEIELSTNLAKSNDFRRFGLLTLLLKGNTSNQQQKIIEAISANWSGSSVSKDTLEPIEAVWTQRIDHVKTPPSDEKLALEVEHYSHAIDTSLAMVLLAGNIGHLHKDLVRNTVQKYISNGEGLRAVDLLASLPIDAVDTQSHIDLISHFVDRNHWDLVAGLAALLQRKINADHSELTDSQQVSLSTALANAGQIEILKSFYDSNLLSKLALQKDRSLGIASLNAALNTFGQVGTAPHIDVKEADADLLLLSELVQNVDISVPSVLAPPDEIDSGLWVRAGKLLWSKNKQRAALIDFMKSDTPVALKLMLARGTTTSNGFDASSEDGQQLYAALKNAEMLQPSGMQQEANAKLIAASFGEKSDMAKLPAGGNDKEDFALDYGERLSKYKMSSATDSSFALETADLRKIKDYSKRVSAFRSLAELKANKLDTAKWLGDDASIKIANDPNAVPAIAETDGPFDVSNSLVAIKNTNDDFLREPARRPAMPGYYPSSADVYSILPIPFKSKASVAIGGESRIDRLTRFASEHYEDVSNLGVKEHLYNAAGNITPKFIFVNSGVTSMGQLLQSIGHFNPEMISEKDGNILLQAPLIIGPDATLLVSGEEFKVLRLSQQKGSFIINAGKVYFSDVEVIGYDEAKSAPATMPVKDPGIKFRPFILSWSASLTFAANSKFEALGYSAGSAYGFSLSSGPADEIFSAAKPAAPSGMIVDSSFENLYYGFYAFEAEDVKLVGNEYRDGVVYGLDPHDRSRHLLMAFNSAYGTHKKHGIIISREVDDSYIVGNMSFDNAGTGIMLDRESTGTIIFANSLMNNKGDGFAALESPCALLSNNNMEGNSRIGIKVRNSWDIHIDGNVVRRNGGSGIEAYTDRLEDAAGSEARNFKEDPYSPIATLTVVRNRLQENLTAIRTNGVAAATLFDNQFINQAPKLFAGDVKGLALDILAKSSEDPITIVSNCTPKVPVRKMCTLLREGVILSQSTNRDFSASATSAAECFAKMKTDARLAAKKVN